MIEKRQTTVGLHPEAHRVLKRVAETRRWSLVGFFNFLAELFVLGLDGIDDPENDLAFLRQKYCNWTLTVGSGEVE